MTRRYGRYIVATEHEEIKVVNHEPNEYENVITRQEKDELVRLFFDAGFYGQKPVFSATVSGNIRASSIVGSIKLTTGTVVEVLPKFSKKTLDDPISLQNCRVTLLQMILLSRDDKPIFLESTSFKEGINEIPLLENFVLIFAKKLSRELLKGLHIDYHTVQKKSVFIKGKLLLQKQFRNGLADAAMHYIECDEYSDSNSLMQFFKASVRFLLDLSEFSFITKSALTEALFLLNDVEDVRLQTIATSHFTFNRNSERFALLYSQCIHIISKYYPYTSTNRGNEFFSILYNMDELYERFLSFLFERDNISSMDKKRLHAYSTSDKRRVYGAPDFVFNKSTSKKDIFAVGDAKWKLLNDEKSYYGLDMANFWQLISYMNLAAPDTVPGYFFVPTQDDKSSEIIFNPMPNAKEPIRIIALSFTQPIERLLSTTTFVIQDGVICLDVKPTEDQWIDLIAVELVNAKQNFKLQDFNVSMKSSASIFEMLSAYNDYSSLGIKDIKNGFTVLCDLIQKNDGEEWDGFLQIMKAKASQTMAISKTFQVFFAEKLVTKLIHEFEYMQSADKNPNENSEEVVSIEEPSETETMSLESKEITINNISIYEFFNNITTEKNAIIENIINQNLLSENELIIIANYVTEKFAYARFFKEPIDIFATFFLLVKHVRISPIKLKRALQYLSEQELHSVLVKSDKIVTENMHVLLQYVVSNAKYYQLPPQVLLVIDRLRATRNSIAAKNASLIIGYQNTSAAVQKDTNHNFKKISPNKITPQRCLDKELISEILTLKGNPPSGRIKEQMSFPRSPDLWAHCASIAIGNKNLDIIDAMPVDVEDGLKDFCFYYIREIINLEHERVFFSKKMVDGIKSFKHVVFHPSKGASHTWSYIAECSPDLTLIQSIIPMLDERYSSVVRYVIGGYLRNKLFVESKERGDIETFQKMQEILTTFTSFVVNMENMELKENLVTQISKNWNKNDLVVEMILKHYSDNPIIIENLSHDFGVRNGFYGKIVKELADEFGIVDNIAFRSYAKYSSTEEDNHSKELADKLEQFKVN